MTATILPPRERRAGPGSRSQEDLARQGDPKDTRIYSHSPTAHTKRNPDKTTDNTPHGGMQGLYGKNTGGEADLPWKAKDGKGGAGEDQAGGSKAQQAEKASKQQDSAKK